MMQPLCQKKILSAFLSKFINIAQVELTINMSYNANMCFISYN